jgi:hypothetical protein
MVTQCFRVSPEQESCSSFDPAHRSHSCKQHYGAWGPLRTKCAACLIPAAVTHAVRSLPPPPESERKQAHGELQRVDDGRQTNPSPAATKTNSQSAHHQKQHNEQRGTSHRMLAFMASPPQQTPGSEMALAKRLRISQPIFPERYGHAQQRRERLRRATG